MKNKQVLVITGPTAVGKTAFTLKLAKELKVEILSCDSRQFYREMNIGTAKPSPKELQQVKHYFINSLSIKQDYSAGDFEREGLAFLDTYFKTNDKIVVSGGSGLYIKALCEGFDNFPKVPAKIREEVNASELSKLQEELESHDQEYYKIVDVNNKQRLARAISIIRTSGNTFTSYLKRSKKARNFTCRYIILNRERQELYKRINNRVDKMMEEGLLDEVKRLYQYKELNALQTVGYKELFEFLDGKCSEEEAIELIKRNSRRYAKRQLTWFRNIDGALWKHPDEDYDLSKT